MNRKISIAALMLLSVFALAAISGVLPPGIPSPIDLETISKHWWMFNTSVNLCE